MTSTCQIAESNFCKGSGKPPKIWQDKPPLTIDELRKIAKNKSCVSTNCSHALCLSLNAALFRYSKKFPYCIYQYLTEKMCGNRYCSLQWENLDLNDGFFVEVRQIPLCHDCKIRCIVHDSLLDSTCLVSFAKVMLLSVIDSMEKIIFWEEKSKNIMASWKKFKKKLQADIAEDTIFSASMFYSLIADEKAELRRSLPNMPLSMNFDKLFEEYRRIVSEIEAKSSYIKHHLRKFTKDHQNE